MAVREIAGGDKPGFIAMVVFAVLSAALASWWAASGEVGPAIGFAVLAVAWIIMAFRGRRRVRARTGDAEKSDPST